MALPDICFGKGLELNPVLNDAGFHMCRCATFVKPSKTFGIPAERIRAPVRGPDGAHYVDVDIGEIRQLAVGPPS